MVSSEFLAELNTAYERLEQKRSELFSALSRFAFPVECGWFSGHYCKGATEGERQKNCYPIPVITVSGLCKIKVSFDSIVVSAVLKRSDATEYTHDVLQTYSFESYSVENPFTAYALPGQSLAQFKDAILKSKEKEIGFSFPLPFDATEKQLADLLDLLSREGFYI